MKRKIIFLLSCVLLVVTLACEITMEGIIFSGDPSPEELERERMATLMAGGEEGQQAESSSSSVDGEAVVETAAPTTAPAVSDELPTISRTEINTYSVQATNYDCICTVDGDVETTFNFKGDTMEILDSQGVPTVFTKTSENTYSRSFMGYYILDSASGSTQVEEEKHVVIIFNNDGYIMEHYSGDDGSPCCVHTFTNK